MDDRFSFWEQAAALRRQAQARPDDPERWWELYDLYVGRGAVRAAAGVLRVGARRGLPEFQSELVARYPALLTPADIRRSVGGDHQDRVELGEALCRRGEHRRSASLFRRTMATIAISRSWCPTLLSSVLRWLLSLFEAIPQVARRLVTATRRTLRRLLDVEQDPVVRRRHELVLALAKHVEVGSPSAVRWVAVAAQGRL